MNKLQKYLLTIEALLKKNDVIFAYLFGSYSTGHENEMSDVDFAVYFSDKFSVSERHERQLELINSLNQLIGKEVDIVVLNNRKDEVVQEVFVKGKLIYNSQPEIQQKFRYEFTREYLDFLPHRQEYYDFVIQRLKNRQDSDERTQQHQESIEKIRRMSFDS